MDPIRKSLCPFQRGGSFTYCGCWPTRTLSWNFSLIWYIGKVCHITIKQTYVSKGSITCLVIGVSKMVFCMAMSLIIFTEKKPKHLLEFEMILTLQSEHLNYKLHNKINHYCVIWSYCLFMGLSGGGMWILTPSLWEILKQISQERIDRMDHRQHLHLHKLQ